MESRDTLSQPKFFAPIRDFRAAPYIAFVPVIFQGLTIQVVLASRLMRCIQAVDPASASHGEKHPAAAMKVL